MNEKEAKTEGVERGTWTGGCKAGDANSEDRFCLLLL